MPRVVKVISGGQTGADFGGLVAARMLRLPTGGWAPHGWITERGPRKEILQHYGLQKSHGDYPVRTLQNIQEADFTILIADKLDRGSGLTFRRCEQARQPCWLVKPTDEAVPVEPVRSKFVWADELTLNVAGNRESRSPGIEVNSVRLIKAFLEEFNKS